MSTYYIRYACATAEVQRIADVQNGLVGLIKNLQHWCAAVPECENKRLRSGSDFLIVLRKREHWIVRANRAEVRVLGVVQTA